MNINLDFSRILKTIMYYEMTSERCLMMNIDDTLYNSKHARLWILKCSRTRVGRTMFIGSESVFAQPPNETSATNVRICPAKTTARSTTECRRCNVPIAELARRKKERIVKWGTTFDGPRRTYFYEEHHRCAI